MRKKEMIAMLLAGGQGSRLGVLTAKVAKPAVAFGGKYRIIDFPLSNCINSGIDTVGVLTQYQPLRLNAHIGIGIPWDLDRNYGGVTVLPPYERSGSSEWYSAGFKLTPNLILRGIYGAVFGDIFMKCVYRLRPYEAVPGSVNAMHRKWVKVCQDFVSNGYPSRRKFKRLCREIIEDFDNNIELLDIKKPRVGVVGEILVKFLPRTSTEW